MVTGSTASTNWLKVNLTGTNILMITMNGVKPTRVNNKTLPVIGMLNLN
jgi:hypothetical protein